MWFVLLAPPNKRRVEENSLDGSRRVEEYFGVSQGKEMSPGLPLHEHHIDLQFHSNPTRIAPSTVPSS